MQDPQEQAHPSTSATETTISTEAAQNPKEANTDVEEEAARRAKIVANLRKTFLNAECSPFLDRPNLLFRYPAHLHIDILPQYQGKGHGTRLMGCFLNSLIEKAVPGVHLSMAASNTGARRFYERLGFELCAEVLDGGASGETGKLGDAVYLVRDLREKG